jgi:hypothetical protein
VRLSQRRTLQVGGHQRRAAQRAIGEPAVPPQVFRCRNRERAHVAAQAGDQVGLRGGCCLFLGGLALAAAQELIDEQEGQPRADQLRAEVEPDAGPVVAEEGPQQRGGASISWGGHPETAHRTVHSPSRAAGAADA